MENFDTNFKELEPYIIGEFKESGWFSFVIYADKAPSKGEKILLNKNVYEVDSVVDDTDDEEFEQGLSYSKVYMSIL
jgi:hypothetical protein